MSDPAEWRFYFDDATVAASALQAAVAISIESASGVDVVGYGRWNQEGFQRSDKEAEYTVQSKTVHLNGVDIKCPTYNVWHHEFAIWVANDLEPPFGYSDCWHGWKHGKKHWLLGLELIGISEERSSMVFVGVGFSGCGINLNSTPAVNLREFFDILYNHSRFTLFTSECSDEVFLAKPINGEIGMDNHIQHPAANLRGFNYGNINFRSDAAFDWLSAVFDVN